MSARHATALAIAVLIAASACDEPAPPPASARHGDPLWFQAPQSQGLPREHQSALLLYDGRVLITGGYDTAGLANTEIYDPTTGDLKTVQPLALARWFQTAVMLRTGQPMVIAGKVSGNPNSTPTTELFDPVSEKWSAGPPLNSRRERHTTTVLSDGRVLLVGDWGGSEVTNEIFDPDAGTWSVLPGQMMISRSSHSAVLLSDGRVLVMGGFNNFPPRDVDLAELFDPRTLSWTSAGNFGTGRKYPAAVRLLDGRVLVAGGLRDATGPATISAEVSIFEPDGGTWASLPPLLDTRATPSLNPLSDQRYLIAGGAGTGSNQADVLSLDGGRALDALGPGNGRWGHTAVTLATGEVALFGGTNPSGPAGSVLVYFGGAPLWMAAQSVPAPQVQHSATLLPDGTVLLVGQGAWRYSPASDTWADAGLLARQGHSATLLSDGRVLVIGPGTQVDFYQPSTGTWTASTAMPGPREGHTATLLEDGHVLVAGGSIDGSAANALETALVFDPYAETWTPTGNLAVPRLGHFSTVLRDGRAAVLGGTTAPSPVEVYDSPTRTFISKTFTSLGHRGGVGALLPSGRVLLAGGCCPINAGAEVLDPVTFAWIDGGALPTPLTGSKASVLHSGRTLIVGGVDAGAATITGAWSFDPRRPAFDPLPGPPFPRSRVSATRLLDGRVLVLGGGSSGDAAALFEESAGFSPRPRLDPIPSPSRGGLMVSVTGRGWTELPENSTGHYLSAASNYPLLRLERMDTQEIRFARLLNWSDTGATAVMPDALRAGFYVARIVVSGVPSGPQVFRVDPPQVDGGAPDAGAAGDGGLPDGGLPDGGLPDGGGSDGGGDGGAAVVDGGSVETDGGTSGEPQPRAYRVGCGCGATPGVLQWVLLLVALSASRAHRRRLCPRA